MMNRQHSSENVKKIFIGKLESRNETHFACANHFVKTQVVRKKRYQVKYHTRRLKRTSISERAIQRTIFLSFQNFYSSNNENCSVLFIARFSAFMTTEINALTETL